MTKAAGLLMGAIIAVAGLILLIAWWFEFLFVIRGILPLALIFGGAVWCIAGFSELKDMRRDKEAK